MIRCGCAYAFFHVVVHRICGWFCHSIYNFNVHFRCCFAHVLVECNGWDAYRCKWHDQFIICTRIIPCIFIKSNGATFILVIWPKAGIGVQYMVYIDFNFRVYSHGAQRWPHLRRFGRLGTPQRVSYICNLSSFWWCTVETQHFWCVYAISFPHFLFLWIISLLLLSVRLRWWYSLLYTYSGCSYCSCWVTRE
jgi:hypothetical protein